MRDNKNGASTSPSSDKFSLWELGILGVPTILNEVGEVKTC
jgi:hypothetical protein